MAEIGQGLLAAWRAAFGLDSDRCPTCGGTVRVEEMGGALSVACVPSCGELPGCGERNVWTRDALAAVGARED